MVCISIVNNGEIPVGQNVTIQYTIQSGTSKNLDCILSLMSKITHVYFHDENW